MFLACIKILANLSLDVLIKKVLIAKKRVYIASVKQHGTF